MTRVAGADGARSGWVYVVVDVDNSKVERCALAPTFSELLLQTTGCVVLAIDVPIGLPKRIGRGGRAADRDARRLLRPTRHQSVFTAPPRAVLQARSYDEANELHRTNSSGEVGMSVQAYGILPKIAEVDDLMTPRIQKRVFEVHPELSFRELNGGSPIPLGKTRAGGMLARLRVLERVGLTQHLESTCGDLGSAGLDDVLDATAAAWTAARIHRGEAIRVPDAEETDVRGLRMEMWR